MSYDFEDLPDGHVLTPNVLAREAPRPDDLELIVTVLELAALFLTDRPGDVFTEARLLAVAHGYIVADATVDPAVQDFRDEDAKIVLANMKQLKKVPGGYILR